MIVASLARNMLTRRLQHLILYVTNRCNFRCEHCFLPDQRTPDMPLDVYLRIAKQVGKLFWLDIAGGEPFLRNDLADIVGAFDAKVIQIPTNGSVPDVALDQLQKLRTSSSAQIAVSLSLDGLQKTHEEIRRQPGNWDQVWRTFEKLRSIPGIQIKINTVITGHNAHEIPDLMDAVWEHKPDFHSIILLRGNPRDADVALPDIPKLEKLGQEILKRQGRYDYGQNRLTAAFLRNYHKYLWKTSLAVLRERRQVIPCLAGRVHMVIMANGSVSSCEMLPPAGNLVEQSWQEILQSPTLVEQRRMIRKKQCYCTHNCAMFDSILFRPASYLHLLKP